MAKNQLVMAVSAAFFVGVGCGYLLFADAAQEAVVTVPQAAPAVSAPTQLAQNDQASMPDMNDEWPPASLNEIAQPPVSLNDVAEPQSEGQSPDQDVAQLEGQLAQAQQQIKVLQRALKGPEEMETQLQQLFEQETRDENWAYLTETQTSDFVYSEGFADKVALEKVQCKSTVCRIEFSTLEGAELDPRTGWRQLQSRLDKQPWWRQFQRTSSVSSDGSLSFWVERKPPES
ncbi:hypothetical protein [Pseudoalteromonas sp. T1lg75]|uniref:hypothetical protein n=1 Tax=Pseudoalteromonas sp. T1lg75 TaxID=2077102 RepID=UPI000CF6F641|nr:hypothetical protein [Pseudoalteromonas sp. T1lg75]